MRRRRVRYYSVAVIIVLLLFLLIQIIPYGKDHTNPAVVSEPKWDSQQTRDLVQRACFDCHSNETVWPWYSNVAPVSWLLYHDVAEGRQRMNFSDWQNYYLKDTAELASVISEGEMPPVQYLLMHKFARLSGAEKTQLVSGLQKTIGQ